MSGARSFQIRRRSPADARPDGAPASVSCRPPCQERHGSRARRRPSRLRRLGRAAPRRASGPASSLLDRRRAGLGGGSRAASRRRGRSLVRSPSSRRWGRGRRRLGPQARPSSPSPPFSSTQTGSRGPTLPSPRPRWSLASAGSMPADRRGVVAVVVVLFFTLARSLARPLARSLPRSLLSRSFRDSPLRRPLPPSRPFAFPRSPGVGERGRGCRRRRGLLRALVRPFKRDFHARFECREDGRKISLSWTSGGGWGVEVEAFRSRERREAVGRCGRDDRRGGRWCGVAAGEGLRGGKEEGHAHGRVDGAPVPPLGKSGVSPSQSLYRRDCVWVFSCRFVSLRLPAR